jgi:hypothetical protein
MYWLVVALAATKIIPACIGIIGFKKLKPSLKAFVAFIAVGLLVEITMFSVALAGYHNVFMIHFSSVFLLTALMFFYHTELLNTKVKGLLWSAVAGVVVFSVSYAFQGDNFYNYPSIPKAIHSAITVALALYLFFEMATTGDSKDPIENGVYFINGGIMFYYTSTFVTWLLIKYVINDVKIVYALYGSHAYINAVCNLIYAFGLWKITSRSLSFAR